MYSPAILSTALSAGSSWRRAKGSWMSFLYELYQSGGSKYGLAIPHSFQSYSMNGLKKNTDTIMYIYIALFWSWQQLSSVAYYSQSVSGSPLNHRLSKKSHKKYSTQKWLKSLSEHDMWSMIETLTTWWRCHEGPRGFVKHNRTKITASQKCSICRSCCE